ncbi:pyocin S6 family toxin immunity protein [Pseudomonas fluorescens]|uniref:pyocin S6 family toxin immunity protein n=1 Tax=Pseudomonas fluorescens TaxID=294 RepID=UPI00398F8FC0
MDVAPELNQAVLDLVGWKSFQDGVRHGVVELTAGQAGQIEDVLGKSIPSELDIRISVLA